MSKNRNKTLDRENTAALLAEVANGSITSTDVPNWLGHSGDGNTRIDAELLWGSTLTWIGSPPRRAIKEHLKHLETDHGLHVLERNGVHRIVILPLVPEA